MIRGEAMQEKSRTEKRELEREQGQHKERERERESNKERERPLRILIEETASLKRRQSTNALRSDMLPSGILFNVVLNKILLHHSAAFH